MNTTRVMVVGGYGQVGQAAVAHLLEHTQSHIVVAGRNLSQAQRFCQPRPDRLSPCQLDVTAADLLQKLRGIDLVVMCVEQQDTRFLEACIDCKVHCLDVTATRDFMEKAAGLQQKARQAGVTVLLSVGLSPGLSNLLALHAKGQLDQVDRVFLTVLLGLGEHHGKLAVQWTVQNLLHPFQQEGAGSRQTVAPFSQGRDARFPPPYGLRRGYRFNYADQHVLQQTLGVREVQTRMCFDSAPLTMLLAGLCKVGFFRLLKRLNGDTLLQKVFENVHAGTQDFGLSVEAHGQVQGQPRVWQGSLLGTGEGKITGQMAGWSAVQVLTGQLPAGVYHSEQVLDPSNALDFARSCGVQVQLGSGVQQGARVH